MVYYMIYTIPLIIGLFANLIAGNYVRKRAEKRLAHPYTPLPDLLHDCFPKNNNYNIIIPVFLPDYFLLVCIVVVVYNRSSLVEFEKNVLNIGLCSIIRSFSICFTTMPPCMPKPAGWFHGSHDLMFSGHSLFFIGIGNMLNSSIIPVLGPFLLVVARQHYTIDVCVSGLVYFAVYTMI